MCYPYTTPASTSYFDMAKGISSKNSLKALAYPVQQFIAGWGLQERASKAAGAGDQLPAPYELAALRGEAVLRDRFFGALMEKIPVQLSPDQQIALWHSMVEEGGLVTAWAQRLGIAKALRREAVLPSHVNQDSRKLYCLLLDALAKQAPQVLPWAVEAYFWHCWRDQFPEAGVGGLAAGAGTSNSKDPAVLRERLLRALRKAHKETVELKESFKELEASAGGGGACIQFTLLVKRPSAPRWEALASAERPRLKTARLAAYEAALTQKNEAGKPLKAH